RKKKKRVRVGVGGERSAAGQPNDAEAEVRRNLIELKLSGVGKCSNASEGTLALKAATDKVLVLGIRTSKPFANISENVVESDRIGGFAADYRWSGSAINGSFQIGSGSEFCPLLRSGKCVFAERTGRALVHLGQLLTEIGSLFPGDIF